MLALVSDSVMASPEAAGGRRVLQDWNREKSGSLGGGVGGASDDNGLTERRYLE